MSRKKINEPSITIIINKQYKIGKKLGCGSFGDVFEGVETQTGLAVAIKMERDDSPHAILSHEYEIYQQIYKPNIGVPKIHYFGTEGDYKVMVMDILGPSLEDIYNFCGRKFSLKTILMIADQMISRLEYLHRKNFIHRDVKPENFLIGIGHNCDQIYLVDLGLAKKYRNETKHISYKEGHRLIGTARYASIYSHKGIQLSRRDDLESLGYVLIYFAIGRLPWQSIKIENKEEKYIAIQQMKDETSIEQLCANLPEEFILYMQHVRSLNFTEKPNYGYLRELFSSLMKRHKFPYDLIFDWNKKTQN